MSEQALDPDVPAVTRGRPVNVAVARVAADAPADVEPSTPPVAANPLLKVRQLLRGRYLWAVGLALLLAAPGLVGGYKLDVPKYRSTGLVRVRLSLPRIMFPTDQNGVMPAYEAFINSQLALIRSERVLDRAMQVPAWKERGRPMSLDAFAGSLEVKYPKGTEYISISFSSQDPETARAAVSAMMGAYLQIYEETDVDGQRQRQTLDERKLQLTAELERLEGVVSTLSPFGATAVEQNHSFKLSELNKLEAEMRRVELAIAGLDTGGGSEAGPATRPSAPTPQEVARFDPEVRRLLDEKRTLAWEAHRLRLLKFGNEHATLREAEGRLRFLDEAIKERVEEFGPHLPSVAPLPAAGDSSAATASMTAADLPALRQQVQNLKALHERTHKEVTELSSLGTQVHTLTRQAEAVRHSLDATKDRLESLDVESGIGGRLSILSEPDRPSGPEKDRRKLFAAAGGIGGAGAGIALVLLFGLLDSRFRYAADAEVHWGQSMPVLGVLPELPQYPTSDDLGAAPAAGSLHQIRAMLQIHSRSAGDRVFAVTSPSAAAGKTSFVLALGVSFAASGSRTLLVDFDVVGGGLSARLQNQLGGAGPRRKLGRILRQLKMMDRAQLAAAARHARQAGRTLDRAVVELGYATEQDVERALDAQEASEAGLLDALGGEPLADCIAETGLPGLFVLPLGSDAGTDDGVRLSPAAAHRLLEEARQKFDVVLVDTGPVPGSVEASVVASQADQVLLVLTRGETRGAADRSVEHLRRAGAQVAGVVFNRARGDDGDVYSASASSSRQRSEPRRPGVAPAPALLAHAS